MVLRRGRMKTHRSRNSHRSYFSHPQNTPEPYKIKRMLMASRTILQDCPHKESEEKAQNTQTSGDVKDVEQVDQGEDERERHGAWQDRLRALLNADPRILRALQMHSRGQQLFCACIVTDLATPQSRCLRLKSPGVTRRVCNQAILFVPCATSVTSGQDT